MSGVLRHHESLKFKGLKNSVMISGAKVLKARNVIIVAFLTRL